MATGTGVEDIDSELVRDEVRRLGMHGLKCYYYVDSCLSPGTSGRCRK